MKKIGYILLAVLLLLPCIAFPAWAQAPSLALEASGGSGEAGETVTVAVRLTENPGVTSVKLSLSYDSTALVLKKAENGTLFDGWYQASPTTGTLPYLMVWVASEVQSGTGELILLEFQIADGATVGTVTSPTVCIEEAYCNGTALLAEPIKFDIEVICRHTYGAYTSVDALTHQRECSKCHAVEPSDHVWDAGTVTTPATHLTVGTKTFTCTDCGETKTEEIPKDATHTYGAWEKHNETQHKRTCACGDIQYLNHAWGAGSFTTPATHLTVGTKTFTCTDCGETKTEEIPKLHTPPGEDPSDDPTKNPSDDPTKDPSGEPLKDRSNAWILPTVIGAVTVCIAAAVVLWLILKKRQQAPAPMPPTDPKDDEKAPVDLAAVDESNDETITEDGASLSPDAPMQDSVAESAEMPAKEPCEIASEALPDDLTPNDPNPDAEGDSANQAPDDLSEKNTEDETERTDSPKAVSDNDADEFL
ncbi:MAG: hypothetical protein J6B71_02070, partial [Clostridia bacterium]|nr:hypothetical protein [Clostridia bacterium]